MVKHVYFCDICGQNFDSLSETAPPAGRIQSYRVCVDGINLHDYVDYQLGDIRIADKECLRCVCFECRQKIGEFIRREKQHFDRSKSTIEKNFNAAYFSE